LWLRLALDEPVSAEGSQRRKDGSTSPVEVRAGLLEANGRRLALSVARDISERKALTEQLSYRAFRDPLTGLHNRTLFMDRLERALMRADRKGNAVAILFLDLDDFKVINDSLGHDTGDQILLEVGRRLDSGVRVSDTVARPAGDEFVVLLDDVGDEEEAALVAERIRVTLEASFELGGTNCASPRASASRSGSRPEMGLGDCCATRTWRCTRPRRRARIGARSTIPAPPRVAEAGGAYAHSGLTCVSAGTARRTSGWEHTLTHPGRDG
jgi:diguanylate cyclase (GGDEF)-like protein